jgi:hypothetical protein
MFRLACPIDKELIDLMMIHFVARARRQKTVCQ